MHINFRDLLKPLNSHNGAGEAVHLSYDVIKEARREDDTRLTQGVWKIKPKKADWPLVIELCHDILQNTSKDLQILSFFTEAWIAHYQIKGMKDAIVFFNAFCQTFWSVLYPNVLSIHMDQGHTCETTYDDSPDDNTQQVIEHRDNILQWLDRKIAQQILFFMLVPARDLLPQVTLAAYIDAQDAHKRYKTENSPLLESLRKSIGTYPTEERQNLQGNLQDIIEAVTTLQQDLAGFDLPLKGAYFTQTHDYLTRIIQILRTDYGYAQEILPLLNNQGPLPRAPLETAETAVSGGAVVEDDVVSVSEQRNQAYQALRQIADFLSEIDPHSPSPQLLNLVVSWQHKSLAQIMQDVSQGTTDAHVILQWLQDHHKRD